MAASASAQRRAHAPQPEDILPDSELDDPIGVDSESRSLEREAAARVVPAPTERELSSERARFGPLPPPLDVRAGEVLTAHASTRETAHRVQVDLDPGSARVAVEMEFENRSSKPTELRYRLAVPEGSEPDRARGLQRGRLSPGSARGAARRCAARTKSALLSRRAPNDKALPIARAASEHDARGDGDRGLCRAARRQTPLRVRVTYASELPLHGGVARLVLPARGMDPQAAPAEVHVTSSRLIDLRIAGQPASDAGASIDPWSEVALFARAKSGEGAHAAAWQFACGTRRCARAEVWAGPRAAAPVDLVIALDLSPSTEGPARGRLVPAMAGLLSAAPAGSRVRALGFAARARPLVATAMDPSQVELAPFSRAVAEGDLGSATRFEAVWEVAQAWFGKRARAALRPLIVIVGDGGLTEGDARAFEKARAAGVEVSALNLADRATTDALRARVLRGSGVVLDAGSEADAAARGRDPALLAERLAALFAPTRGARERQRRRAARRARTAARGRAGSSIKASRARSRLRAAARTRSASAADRALALALAARARARRRTTRRRVVAGRDRRARPDADARATGRSRRKVRKPRAIGAAPPTATARSAAMRCRSRSPRSACASRRPKRRCAAAAAWKSAPACRPTRCCRCCGSASCRSRAAAFAATAPAAPNTRSGRCSCSRSPTARSSMRTSRARSRTRCASAC